MKFTQKQWNLIFRAVDSFGENLELDDYNSFDDFDDEVQEAASILALIQDEMCEQSIPDGTEVIFDNKGFQYGEFGDENISKKEYKQIDGKPATVKCLDTYSELGNKNGEYYTIEFKKKDGTKLVLVAVNGYHLTVSN